MFDQVKLIQIDSVNVLARSQELPLFARLGPHNRTLLPAMAADAELFEYWAHEASLLPIAHHHLFRWLMHERHWSSSWASRVLHDRPGYFEAVLAEVAACGPITATELSDPGAKSGPWWGWSHGKQALELLFRQGRVTARRRSNFEREYDLVERMIPADVLARPVVDEADARRELLTLAADALGVATARDLLDYYRMNVVKARPRIAELVEEGRLVPVRVEGWKDEAYLAPGAAMPRRITARALLSPFDSLVWDRARLERVFGVRHRIEIYTPQPKRIYGYYVLLFLLGESIAARVDLKADRHAGVLRVHGAFLEPGHDPIGVGGELAEELALMAGWLGLDSVGVGEGGDLAPVLRRIVGRG